MKTCLFILLMLFLQTVSAEHRVYQLEITNTKTGKKRQVLSTMEPSQYIGYHHLGWYETIVILDHWMCWERHQRFKKLCTRPTAGEDEGQKTGSERELASPSSAPE